MIALEKYFEHPRFTGLKVFPTVDAAREAVTLFHKEHGGSLHKYGMQVTLPNGARMIFDGPGVKQRLCGFQFQFVHCHPLVPLEDVQYCRSRLRRPLEGLPLMLVIS